MKNLLHKFFSLGILSLLWLSFTIWLVNAQNSYGNTFWDAWSAWWVWISWAGTAQWDKLVSSVKVFINRVLGILALITLVILLRWGFQMVTAAWDDTKYKAWFKILKQAWFGLAFIWLSWLVVSMIFRVIWLVAA